VFIACAGRIGFDGVLGFWPNIVLPRSSRPAPVLLVRISCPTGPFRVSGMRWCRLVQSGVRLRHGGNTKVRSPFVKAFQVQSTS